MCIKVKSNFWPMMYRDINGGRKEISDFTVAEHKRKVTGDTDRSAPQKRQLTATLVFCQPACGTRKSWWGPKSTLSKGMASRKLVLLHMWAYKIGLTVMTVSAQIKSHKPKPGKKSTIIHITEDKQAELHDYRQTWNTSSQVNFSLLSLTNSNISYLKQEETGLL